jgi:hypothetical protein
MRHSCSALRHRIVLLRMDCRQYICAFLLWHWFRRCKERSILANRNTRTRRLRRYLGNRRMDWLDNGNNPPAETNRRNNKRNGRKERRAKTRGASSREHSRRKENEKEKLKQPKAVLLIMPQAAAPSSLFFNLYNIVPRSPRFSN